MEIGKKISEFLVKTNFQDLPREAVTAMKRAMLDTLGVTFAGSTEPAGKILTGFVKKFESKPVCGVIGGKIRTSSPNAALANGTMAHALDYDDTGAGCQGHPSVPLMPTVLALGEELGCSGKEIITAYVLGAEVWSKIASQMPMLHLKGWHPTAVFGTLGAAAAAAKLLKLESDQTMMALGLAGSQAAGLGQNFGTMTKPFHAGNAARSGIVAALLVKEGFTATQEILGGHLGFPMAFFGGQKVEVARMADNLGKPFAVVSPGINVKKFPSCYLTHRAIDALLHLIKEHDLKPGEIEDVDCQVPPRAVKILFYNAPSNGLQGKFSMPFCLAVALMDRKVGLAQVTDEKVKDPVIQELERKIKMRSYPDADEKENGENRPDVVIVRLKNGKEYSHGVLRAKGHADAPLTWDELLEKYRECARLVLDDKGVERTIELMGSLEKLPNIKELMNIATGSG
ncbi:MAG: MmgE/PrpD family protein [Proteobacteria bacterium]|nr:MmgE/PrpD family protein [Pseudomonadota bacterium]